MVPFQAHPIRRKTSLRFQKATALTHELLDRLATILPPPRIHRHRYHGVFAPDAPLRPLVTERARQDNALAVQQPAPPLPTPTAAPAFQPEEAEAPTPDTVPSRSSTWAALLARVYEVFPLICPICQAPLTFIAFLTHHTHLIHIPSAASGNHRVLGLPISRLGPTSFPLSRRGSFRPCSAWTAGPP